MSTYIIGDLQGCLDELKSLLSHINYKEHDDQLWFVGDLVNRGPKSLETLRFVSQLPNTICVLGNHDLHLLALDSGITYHQHTMQAILEAPDRKQLIDWLRQRPLVHYDSSHKVLMAHAGILPSWDLGTTLALAKELEAMIRSPKASDFFQHMYGDKPDRWHPSLTGYDRLRFICNVLTRMRFITTDQQLDLNETCQPGDQTHGLIPWFEVPNTLPTATHIVIGHWAALNGHTGNPMVHATDTGCFWGNQLTALRLDDFQRFSVPATRSNTKKS